MKVRAREIDVTDEVAARLLAGAEVDKKTGCWVWVRFVGKNGYGGININGVCRLAHRAAYQYFRGDLDTTLTCDHLCGNRVCINPWHIEQVTLGENTRRAFKRRPKRKSCGRGHKIEEVGLRGGGCAACIAKYQAEYYEANKESLLEYHRGYRERNRERIRRRKHEYYLKTRGSK